jgi:hypothetical protein
VAAQPTGWWAAPEKLNHFPSTRPANHIFRFCSLLVINEGRNHLEINRYDN